MRTLQLLQAGDRSCPPHGAPATAFVSRHMGHMVPIHHRTGQLKVQQLLSSLATTPKAQQETRDPQSLGCMQLATHSEVAR